VHPLLIESFLPRVTRAQQEALQFGGSQGAKQTRGVSHYGLAIYIQKYLKAKEELWNYSNISPCKNIPNLQKNPLKETKILQDIITLKLISSFNTSQNMIFQKSSYKNRPIIIT
jgi:hypothetical protein